MKIFYVVALSFLLNSCFLAPYQLDFNQGNLVSDETISQLKIGMMKNQVRFLLGTPLLDDFFRKNTWYYVFASGDPENLKLNHRICNCSMLHIFCYRWPMKYQGQFKIKIFCWI